MLMRFDPFREADQLFDQLRGRTRLHAMPLDAYRRRDVVFVHFDLPGVDPDSIDVTVDRDLLTVTAERSWQVEEGDQIVAQERPEGRFERSLYLGENLDREHLEAHYQNGVLTLRVPVQAAAEPYRVPVAAAHAGNH